MAGHLWGGWRCWGCGKAVELVAVCLMQAAASGLPDKRDEQPACTALLTYRSRCRAATQQRPATIQLSSCVPRCWRRSPLDAA